MILFWVAVLALTTLLYVVLDGFDLGVGILFGFSRSEDVRRKMLAAVSPVWDGNETWLVFTGTILFGAFPRVYATLLSAFYLPIIAMLGALILRGVAFEFRYKVDEYALAVGSRLLRRLPGCLVRARRRGRSLGSGPSDGRRAICRRYLRLVQPVRMPLWRGALSRLCIAWGWVADGEV